MRWMSVSTSYILKDSGLVHSCKNSNDLLRPTSAFLNSSTEGASKSNTPVFSNINIALFTSSQSFLSLFPVWNEQFGLDSLSILYIYFYFFITFFSILSSFHIFFCFYFCQLFVHLSSYLFYLHEHYFGKTKKQKKNKITKYFSKLKKLMRKKLILPKICICFFPPFLKFTWSTKFQCNFTGSTFRRIHYTNQPTNAQILY